MEEKSLKININITDLKWPKKCGKHLFKELHHDLAAVPLWRMESVEVVHMGAELLHGTGTEGVTCCNQHTELILHQPEGYLVKGKARLSFIVTW